MRLKFKIILSVLAVSSLSGGIWLGSIQQQSIDLDSKLATELALAEARKSFSPIQGAVLNPARKVSIPALKKDDGSDFVIDDLQGNWHFLFFGYTNCPDICPVTMGVTAQAKKLAKESDEEFPDVIFISIDPDRDKIESLASYVQYFDKDFVGVTGEKRLIKALTLQMSIVYMKAPLPTPASTDGAIDVTTGDNSGYMMDHSSALLLLNPKGQLKAFFNPPHDPNTILKDFQTILNLKK